MTDFSDDNVKKKLQGQYELTDKQADFAFRVACGEVPIDAVLAIYNYNNKQNAYGQLSSLVGNKKIDAAMRSLGFSLKDEVETKAFGIIKALQDIAYSDKTGVRDKLAALKELAKYNPVLRDIADADVDPAEKAAMEQRVKDWLAEEG